MGSCVVCFLYIILVCQENVSNINVQNEKKEQPKWLQEFKGKLNLSFHFILQVKSKTRHKQRIHANFLALLFDQYNSVEI